MNKILEKTMVWLAAIGATNWGLIAINPGWDVVKFVLGLFGQASGIVMTLVLLAVGASGLVIILRELKVMK